VPAPREKLTGERLGEPSSLVATRVEVARVRQRKRLTSHDSHIVSSADARQRLTDVRVREAFKLGATGKSLMRSATRSKQLH
jgi:hypothetical protein